MTFAPSDLLSITSLVFLEGLLSADNALVIALLVRWDMTVPATIVAILLSLQLVMMPKLVAQPALRAPWYAARGVTLYVLGMLAAALGLGGYL